MDTCLKPLDECATSTLRKELKNRNLPHSGTRTQFIQELRSHGVTIVPNPTNTPKPVQQPTNDKRDFHPAPLPPGRNYSPMSPYVPCASVSRSNELISDAAYTVLRTHDIRSVRSLHVAEVDVIAEIQDIKTLKNKLVEDYITLRNDVEHLKVVLQNTLNHDLYMYNIANDIAWNDFDNYIRFSIPSVTIIDPRFFGKIEDSVVHGNLHFEIAFDSNPDESDSFEIDLPILFDGVLETCPIMVLVYSNYDESSSTYASESTTCHAYVHRDDPSKLRVFCPSLKDYNRLQFDITLRYLGKSSPTMLSPSRFSSMHYVETTSERGHDVKHHWTELEDRVELFTNVNIVTPMDGVDTIDVKLPVVCSDERYIDVVGYGIVQYTVTSDTEQTLIYSNNTPLVSISQTDTTMLFIKSPLMLNINNYSDMSVATHIVYTKKAPENVVQNFTIDPVYTVSGQQVTASFDTSYAVNSFYFQSIKAIHGASEFELPIAALNGFQSKWSFRWTIPNEITDGTVRFAVLLYDKVYETTNQAFVITNPLSSSDVSVSVVNIGSHDLTFWLESINTTHDVPYRVRVDAVRPDDSVDATMNIDTFSKSSNRVWVQLTLLRHNTSYRIRFVFTDPFDRTTVFETSRHTLDIESGRPVFYGLGFATNTDGTVSVTGEVHHSIHHNFTWHVFAGVNELTDTRVLQIVADHSQVLQGNSETIEGNLSAYFSANGTWVDVSPGAISVYFVAFSNIDSTHTIERVSVHD